MELYSVIFGIAFLVGVAYLFLTKSSKAKGMIIGRLMDSAKAHSIPTSGSLKNLVSALSVKVLRDFVTHQLKHAAITELPVALQVALIHSGIVRVTAVCEMLQLPTFEVVSSVVRGVYAPSYETTKFGRLSIGELVKSFTEKNIKDFHAADTETKGTVVLTALGLMSAPLELSKAGSEVESSALALRIELSQVMEAMRDAG